MDIFRSLSATLLALFDLLEIEQAMLSSLVEVESYNVDTSPTVAFVSVKINEDLIKDMIGRVEETATIIDDGTNVIEMTTFTEFRRTINTIAPKSETHAWVGEIGSAEIKPLSSQSTYCFYNIR